MKKDLLDSPIEEKQIPAPRKKSDYFEIKLPRISFKDTYINPYFVIISLIIFSFLLGMLTNKILVLQNTLKTAIAEGTQAQAANNAGANNNAPQYPTPPPKVDVAIGHLPVLGDENAKVTVVEFSDLQCPYCKQFKDNTYPEIYDKYIKTNKIKFAYRHYPLKTIHPNSQKASEATECANEQNKFWDYEEMLFKNQSSWSPLAAADAINTFTDYAGQLGLDTAQFRNCLETDKYQKNVDEDSNDGNKASVDGTPGFFINGWRLTGAQPFSEFERLIEQELKK